MKPESVDLAHVRGKITTAEYWAAVRPRFDFAAACVGCETWIARLRQAVDAGFARLDALARADPFWRDTNALATVAKLRDFALHEMGNDDANEDAALLFIADALHAGGDHLELLPWRVLREAGQLDVGFAVCTAFNMSGLWTDANIVRLAGLATRLKESDRFDAALGAFAAHGAEQAAWATQVRAELT